MDNISEALDWGMDSAEEGDGGGWVLLEPGAYMVRIARMERGYHAGSAKMAPCPKAVLHIEADGPEGTARWKEQLFLSKSVAWKIAAFFLAIGAGRNADGTVAVDWNRVEGRTGCALVKVRAYAKRDGGEGKVNEVVRWLAPDDPLTAQALERMAAAQAVQPPAQPGGWSM